MHMKIIQSLIISSKIIIKLTEIFFNYFFKYVITQNEDWGDIPNFKYACEYISK